jgi:hypothetical protein
MSVILSSSNHVYATQCGGSELLCGVKPHRACERNEIIHNEMYKVNFLMI